MAHVYNRNASPLCSVGAYRKGEETIDSKYRLVQICRSEELDADLTGRLRQDGKAVLVLALPVEYRLYREMFRRIQEAGLTNPAIIRAVVPGKEKERIRLVAASQLGGFFLDRLAGGLWIETPEIEDLTFPLELSRNIFTVCRSASV